MEVGPGCISGIGIFERRILRKINGLIEENGELGRIKNYIKYTSLYLQIYGIITEIKVTILR